MNKVYVIYEVREEDYQILNNLQVSYDCVKVFDNKDKATGWFKSELEFQCDKIEYQGKIVYEDKDADKNELWLAKVKETSNEMATYHDRKINNSIIVAHIYYCGEWQYTMYLKEMEVE